MPPPDLPTRRLYVIWFSGVSTSPAGLQESVMVVRDGLPTAFAMGVVGGVLGLTPPDGSAILLNSTLSGPLMPNAASTSPSASRSPAAAPVVVSAAA